MIFYNVMFFSDYHFHEESCNSQLKIALKMLRKDYIVLVILCSFLWKITGSSTVQR